MKHSLKYMTCLFLLFSGIYVLAQEDGGEGSCPIQDAPSPAVVSYQKNIRTIIEATKQLAASSTCVTPSGYPSRLDTVIPIHNVVDLMGRIHATSYNIGSMVSDIRYYVTNSAMVLPIVQEHQNGILELEKEITEAAHYVGTRCADAIKFEKDIPVEGSIYLTKDRTLDEVLTDMYGQTSHVLMYFRNRVTNIADEKYIDETYFSMAPKGFALEMREYFTSEALQQCHDAEPKNKAIKETMKEGFTAGWKFPEAIQIWKDAYKLLLYRGSQIGGNTKKDPAHDAEIDSVVSAQKGGLGNSRFVINSQFFKEFQKRANNETVMEMVKDTAQRIAYQSFGQYVSPYPLFSTVSGFFSSKETPLPVTQTGQVVSDQRRDEEFKTLEAGLYSEYSRLRDNVSQSKEQDPQTVSSLVQSLDSLEKIRDTIEENNKIACANLDKQGINISKAARCDDLMKSR